MWEFEIILLQTQCLSIKPEINQRQFSFTDHVHIHIKDTMKLYAVLFSCFIYAKAVGF
jgi:hypothetical protein